MSIKKQFDKCLKGFQDLGMALRSRSEIEIASNSTAPESPAPDRDPASASFTVNNQDSDRVQDLFERFAMWAANCAADRRGRLSLDHRLSEASHVRDQVLQLLIELETALITGS